MTSSDSLRPWQILLLAGLCLFTIAPFVVLCFYAHPCADDWYMAVGGRDLGFWGANSKWFAGISGRIVQQATTTLHPIRISTLAYQLWCLGLLVAMAGALWRFTSAWLCGQTRAVRWLSAGLGFMLLLWAMRSPSQGLYWVNGANTYPLAFILQLLMGAWLARAWHEPDHRPSVFVIAGVMITAMLASWCTELAMSLQLLTLLLVAVAQWLEQRRVHRLFIFTIVATLLATPVIFLSPGVALRMKTYHNEILGHPIPALVLAAKLAVVQVVTWVTSAPFFLLALLSLHLWQVPPMDRAQAWRRILLALVLMVGTTWGGYFVGTWATGQRLPPRAVNLLGFFFLIEWAVLIAGVLALIRASGWAKPVLTPVAFALVLLAIGAGLKGTNNVKAAWRDLLKGDAKKFAIECEQRYALILESKTDDVTVPALRTKPVSLFFNDLKPEADDWRNKGMAEFYHKKTIRVSE